MEKIYNRPSMPSNIMDNFDFASQYTNDIPNMEFLLSPPESESQDSDSARHYEVSSPEAMSSPKFVKDVPRLIITEQPVEKFRFRYKSEMAGTHGCLNGRTSDKSRKLTYPSVELKNYERSAIIRCSLYTAPTKDHPEQFAHAHRLMREDDPDPHDIEVGPALGYEAVFSNMGIIHTARKHISEELKKKKKRLYKEKRQLGAEEELKIRDKTQIEKEIAEEVKRINLNTVTLCFEAFEKETDGSFHPICEKIFSDPINNSKSAMTGELKICRMDKAVSSCRGGEEIFMFVEKVVKKNIEVRFFEINDNEEIVWTSKGLFNDLDVHHQYAIAFKTPPYHNMDIKDVVQVFVELYRPSDGDRSEPRPFRYKPAGRSSIGSKRKRYSVEIPTTLESYDLSGSILDGQTCVEEIEEMSNAINSEEFKRFFAGFVDDLPEYSETLSSSSSSIQPDGKFVPYSANKKSSKSLSSKEDDKLFMSNVLHNNIYTKVIKKLKSLRRENGINQKSQIHNYFKFTTKDEGDNILHMAINSNIEDDVYILIQMLKDLGSRDLINLCNYAGETALHRAVRYGFKHFINALIKNGADPNISDSKGDTVFHSAFKYNHPEKVVYEIIAILSKSSCVKPDLENDDGLTPIHLAIRYNNLEATKVLVEAGADVNHISSHDGDSALHMAVEKNNVEILEYLLKYSKVNINQQNFGGYTALHKAVAEENTKICRMLRFYNADPNIPNNMSVEIKLENGQDEDEDADAGITSVQLALHNKDILDILKTEPTYLSEDTKIDIKEEDIDMGEDNKPPIMSIDELACIFDKSNLWEKLTEFFSCQDFIDIYKQTPSPTRALMAHQKANITLAVIKELITFLKESKEDSTINEIVNTIKNLNVINIMESNQ